VPARPLPVVILGGGYAGVALAHRLSDRAPGPRGIVLVDRHPVHVLRTELYEVGAMSRPGSSVRRWAVPIDRVVDRPGVAFRQGTIEAINVDRSTVTVSGEPIAYSALAICLGSVPAYYGVPGAEANMQQVYSLTGAMRLAASLRGATFPSGQAERTTPVRVVIVGGGSTGTEVAAEIATADWSGPGQGPARALAVSQVCGGPGLLAGLPADDIVRAREFLARAGVHLDEGRNVTRVEPGRLLFERGPDMPFEIGVWAAGVEAPSIVRAIPGPHGHAGRLRVRPTLQLEGHPEVVAVGDSAEIEDAASGGLVPQTAQAAIVAASAAADNLRRYLSGEPTRPFLYRTKGLLISVGRGKATGRFYELPVWGRPGALLKSLSEAEYRTGAETGGRARRLVGGRRA
jgi:NADH:ubiquinone reductase (H+-translocating)